MGKIKDTKGMKLIEEVRALKKEDKYQYTTFNLTQEAHDALKKAVQYFGIKNAELLRIFVPQYQFLAKEEKGKYSTQKKVDVDKIRKTYRVNKSSLAQLEEMSKKNKIYRDVIIEGLTRYMKWLVDAHTESEKEAYEYALEGGGEEVQLGLVNGTLLSAEEVEEYLKENLDADDPALMRLSKITAELSGLIEYMQKRVDKGKPAK